MAVPTKTYHNTFLVQILGGGDCPVKTDATTHCVGQSFAVLDAPVTPQHYALGLLVRDAFPAVTIVTSVQKNGADTATMPVKCMQIVIIYVHTYTL